MNNDELDIDSLLGSLDIDGIVEETETSSESSVTKTDKNHQIGLGGEVTEDLKLVSQLDLVTKETEENATAVFDILYDISNDLSNMGEVINKIKQKDISSEEGLEEVEDLLNHSNNVLFEGMSLMQYQDISRQKIERVVNVMRSLIKYLNLLFEGSISDGDRTSSAAHIEGDGLDEELLDDTDLEDLINNFNK
jgi:hypothetical protein